MGYVKDGAVFVQTRDDGRDEVFVVKGICSHLSEVLSGAVPIDGFPFVHTVLVPFAGAITYMIHLIPPKPISPATLDKMAARARTAYDRAVAEKRVHRTLTDKGLARTVAKRDGEDGSLRSAAAETALLEDPTTAAAVNVATTNLFWHPFKDFTDPRTMDALKTAIEHRQPGILHRGFKHTVGEAVIVKDEHVCKFCHSKKPFARCCKASVLRAVSTHQKRNSGKLQYTLDPPPEDLVQAMDEQAARNPHPRAAVDCGATDLTKLSIRQLCELELSVSPELGLLCLQRLLQDQRFHDRGGGMVDFIGPLPTLFPMGLLTFGNVELLPDNPEVTLRTSKSLDCPPVVAQPCTRLPMDAGAFTTRPISVATDASSD